MKRSIAMLLALLCLLTGCNPEGQPNVTVESNQPTSAVSMSAEPSTEEPIPAALSVWKSKSKSYTIIYSANDPVGKDVATELQRKFRAAVSVGLSFSSDQKSPTDTEILIGSTNRPESNLSHLLTEDSYAVVAVGRKIVLQATDADLLQLAVERFFQELAFTEEEATLPSSTKLIAPAKVRTTLKIASYNIKNGAVAEYDYQLLAQDILKAGAEVVGLQEVDQLTTRNGKRDTLKLLSEYTGMRYYAYLPTISPYRGGEYGIAILSKYPILSTETVYLPKYAEKDEQRGLLRAEINVNGVTVNFLCTHCHWDGFETQLRTIAESVSKLENYVIVGDLNSSNYELHRAVFPNANIAVDEEHPLITSPGGSSIDNMIASANVYVRGCRALIPGHSDHYMIYADMILIDR